MAAQLRDEHGNPVQLTDEHGEPVQLTDEYGNPIHITGIATTQPLTVGTVLQSKLPDTGLLASTGTPCDTLKSETPEHPVEGEGEHKKGEKHEGSEEIQRSTSSSSSSSSSEDDGQGGRRKKKKGLKEKLKDKLTLSGGKHGEEHKGEQVHMESVSSTDTATTAPGGEQHEHEKKSVIEKIKEKLPGHHSH